MEISDFEKAQVFTIGEVLDCTPGAVASKTIIKKTTGNINAVAFDSGEALTGKASQFDTFIHVLEGDVEITVDDKRNLLATGQSIIIPAHSANSMKANARCKMLSAVIKSGYEEWT